MTITKSNFLKIQSSPVSSPGQLQKAVDDLLPRQYNNPPAPVQIVEDKEQEVKEILAVKNDSNVLKYYTSQVDHNKDLEWYPVSNFKYSPYKLRNFHLAYLDLPRPPRKLKNWIKCWKEGLDNYDNFDDNKELRERLRAGFFQRGGNITVLGLVTCYNLP